MRDDYRWHFVKAIVCTRYGPPQVLRLDEVKKPRPKPDEVLVRVHAAGVSVSDCIVRSARVKPAMWLPFRMFVGFRRPRHSILGIELSGRVEEVGAHVTRFRISDDILAYTGRRFGAYGEFACLRDGGQHMPGHCLIARKPTNITHDEAATVASRATLALYFLKRANIENDQHVLVYGASGGIGTFAVQLAKHFGAQVTAVCSTANIDLVRSLGADRVLDYTVDDDAGIGGPYDIFFDAVGPTKNSSLKSLCQAALSTAARSVSVADAVAKVPAADLEVVTDLIAAGKIRPVLDRVYPLTEAAEAHRYVEAGHKRGGVAIALSGR